MSVWMCEWSTSGVPVCLTVVVGGVGWMKCVG